MSLDTRKRPSPAMIVAALALCFALAGTAIAADPVAKITKSKVKKIAKKQADKRLKANVSGSHVNEADHANRANRADNADNATNATNANSLGGVPAASYLQSANVRAEGFASSTDIDNFTSAAFTPIASKTFTAPTAGFAYVTASLSAQDDLSFPGIGDIYFRLAVNGTPVTNDTFYHQIVMAGGIGGDGGNTGAVTDVIPVNAGSNTIALTAREDGSGSFILGRDISILFAPTGSASAIPHAKGGDGSGAGANAQD
jgi:hypothetical protein